jgi:hypothetical protein
METRRTEKETGGTEQRKGLEEEGERQAEQRKRLEKEG